MGAGGAGDAAVEYGNGLLELLRSGECGVAMVGAQAFGVGDDFVVSGDQGVCAAEGLSYERMIDVGAEATFQVRLYVMVEKKRAQ